MSRSNDEIKFLREFVAAAREHSQLLREHKEQMSLFIQTCNEMKQFFGSEHPAMEPSLEEMAYWFETLPDDEENSS